jgi:hypothetical protein
MCETVHFAKELSGRYRYDLPAIPIVSPGLLSYAGNVCGYEYFFEFSSGPCSERRCIVGDQHQR